MEYKIKYENSESPKGLVVRIDIPWTGLNVEETILKREISRKIVEFVRKIKEENDL